MEFFGLVFFVFDSVSKSSFNWFGFRLEPISTRF